MAHEAQLKAKRLVPDRDDLEKDFKKIAREHKKIKKKQEKKEKEKSGDDYFEFASGSEESDSDDESETTVQRKQKSVANQLETFIEESNTDGFKNQWE